MIYLRISQNSQNTVTVKTITKLNWEHIDKFERKIGKVIAVVAHVLLTTQNFVISCCSFVEDEKQMFRARAGSAVVKKLIM